MTGVGFHPIHTLKTSKVLFHCSVEAKAAASMASDPCSHATDHWNVAALRRTSVEAPGPPLPAQGRPSVPSTNLPFFNDFEDFQLQKVQVVFCNIIWTRKVTKSTSSRSTSRHWNMNEDPLKSYFRVPNTNIHLSIYTCTFTYIYVYIYILVLIIQSVCIYISL